MSYVPNPEPVRQDMLRAIGLSRIEDLFTDIPASIKLNHPLNLGPAMSEMEVRRRLQELADKNINTQTYPVFLGAGAYDHYVPAVVEQLLLRSEFYTAYTPYQPEISQGILQAIFEWQTMICQLTGMDVANASMYDGGSALAEGCVLACAATRRKRVVVPDTINPAYLQVLQTYARGGHMEVVVATSKDGVADMENLKALIDGQTAAVVLQHPNFFGNLEVNLTAIEQAVHEAKGLLVMMVDPISLGLLKPPAELGADIVAGEGQSLGNPMSYGGPFLGFLAVKAKYMRSIPGRLVGETTDLEGNRAFVLTLQAREQHIRREKAGSNICSNEALCALAATIYLATVGKKGLAEIAERCHQLALYARNQLSKAGVKLKFPHPFFKEFAVEVADPATVNRLLLDNGIIGGYELDGGLLLAFTEKRTTAEIDRLVQAIGGKVNG